MTQEFEPTDPAAALSRSDRAKLRRAWAQSPAVWRFVPGRGSPKHMRKWLAAQGPADWHDMTIGFDFGSHDLSPLHFVARQASADRATIMFMVASLDLPGLEQQVQRSRAADIRKQYPHVCDLLDLITKGFAAEFYGSAQFQLGYPAGVLEATKAQLDAMCGERYWRLPPHAWDKVEGKKHQPDYVWDPTDSCQRLPFPVWLGTKLRPN